ncbi:unnamed protein product [Urochloa humidicola]
MAIILVRAASPGLSDAARDIHHGSLQCSSSSSLLKRRAPPPRRRWMLCSLRYASLGLDPPETGRASAVYSSLAVNPAGEAVVSSEQKVYDVVLKQAALLKRQLRTPVIGVRPQDMEMPRSGLKEAYRRCGEICEEYAKTFYLGTLLMTEERRRAIWAIYVWCRRTDELVDGPNANYITPTALDRWEKRLEDLFEGRPYDMLDAALSDTISRFPIDIQPFRDMIEGMRSDLRKASARRGRVYLPQDELAQAGLSDEDIFSGVVTNRWRKFMKQQIKRARMFFEEAERGVTELSQASRWPVWASLLLYRQILDEIEANDYNNFTKRAYVGKGKKLLALPVAYGKSLLLPC